MTTVAKPVLIKPSTLVLRCNKRRLQVDPQQAAPHLGCKPTLPPSSCPRPLSSPNPGIPAMGRLQEPPQDEERVKSPERGRERAASLLPGRPEPLRPQPGGSGERGGTRLFTLHVGVALGPERSGAAPAVPWPLPPPPGCRGRYKYPRHSPAQHSPARHGTAGHRRRPPPLPRGRATQLGCRPGPRQCGMLWGVMPGAAFIAKPGGRGSRCL